MLIYSITCQIKDSLRCYGFDCDSPRYHVFDEVCDSGINRCHGGPHYLVSSRGRFYCFEGRESDILDVREDRKGGDDC